MRGQNEEKRPDKKPEKEGAAVGLAEELDPHAQNKERHTDGNAAEGRRDNRHL